MKYKKPAILRIPIARLTPIPPFAPALKPEGGVAVGDKLFVVADAVVCGIALVLNNIMLLLEFGVGVLVIFVEETAEDMAAA